MWIVRIALTRPYTFIVLALVLLILGPLAIVRTPTDILPDIDIPIVAIVWNYGGLSADEMSTRIVYNVERSLTTTVNDIEHIESQSLNGVGLIKVFFQPSAKIEMAVAQVTAIMQTQLRQLPPAAGSGRPGSQGLAGEQPHARGRRHRRWRAEPDPACQDLEDRHARVRR